MHAVLIEKVRIQRLREAKKKECRRRSGEADAQGSDDLMQSEKQQRLRLECCEALSLRHQLINLAMAKAAAAAKPPTITVCNPPRSGFTPV